MAEIGIPRVRAEGLPMLFQAASSDTVVYKAIPPLTAPLATLSFPFCSSPLICTKREIEQHRKDDARS